MEPTPESAEPQRTDTTHRPPEPALGKPGRSRRIPVRPLVALAVLTLVAFGSWCAYWADQRTDQYQLIYVAQRVHDGERMYVDAWENKPPGVAWLGALGMTVSGGRPLGAWIMPGIVTLAGLAVFGLTLASVLSPVSAAAGTILAAIVLTLRRYDAPSVNPDSYAAALDLAACSLWITAMGARHAGRKRMAALCAGLVWAGSTAVKQTGVVGLIVATLVTIAVIARRRVDRRAWIAAGGLGWLGFALGTAAVLGVLMHRGTLGAAWEAAVHFNQGLITGDTLTGALRSWSRVAAGLEPVALALWLALLGVVAAFWRRGGRNVSGPMLAVLMIWWVGQVALALLGPSRSMRYWQATFPPMLCLATVGLFEWEAALRQTQVGRRAVLVVLSVTIAALLGRPLVSDYVGGVASSYVAYTSDDRERDRLSEIGSRVRALVPVDRAVYVWNYDPGVYLYGGRRAACRFTYPRSPSQMQEILDELESGKAFALLTPEGVAPTFTHWCDETCRERFTKLMTRCRVVERVGRYRIRLFNPTDE